MPKVNEEEKKASIKCPRIVYPFGFKEKDEFTFTDQNFIKDLDLEEFFKSIKFCDGSEDFYDREKIKRSTKRLAFNLMVDLNVDKETSEYRLKAFSDLLSNNDLRNKVGEITKGLGGFRETVIQAYSDGKKPDKSELLYLLRGYRSFVNAYLNIENIDDIESGPLKDVASYLKKIKESPEFKELDKGLEKLSGVKSVTAEIGVWGFGSSGEIKITSYSDKEVEVADDYNKQFSYSLSESKRKPDLDIVMENYFIDLLGDVFEPNVPNLLESLYIFNQLDYYVSFSNHYAEQRERGFDVAIPTILPKEERRMEVTDVKHTMIKEAKKGPEYVIPNDIHYDVNQNIIFITGPTSGGKTIYDQVVGLTQWRGQIGQPVFAKSAEISMVDGIHTHFVTTQDVDSGSGEWEDDLIRTKEILENITPWSLVIVNDPYKGVSPAEGATKTMEVIKGYHKIGCPVYFTSHMHKVAEEIETGKLKAAKNFHADCITDEDGKITKYLYKIVPGSAGESYGEETAEKVGLTGDDINKIITEKAKKCGYEELLRI